MDTLVVQALYYKCEGLAGRLRRAKCSIHFLLCAFRYLLEFGDYESGCSRGKAFAAADGAVVVVVFFGDGACSLVCGIEFDIG
jgi:hypothetical protein